MQKPAAELNPVGGFWGDEFYFDDLYKDVYKRQAAECEPFLTCDYRLMVENGYAAVNGVRLMLKASGEMCIRDRENTIVEKEKHNKKESKSEKKRGK